MDANPISLRLPPRLRARLDKAAKLTKQSRSEIMKDALERHLHDIVVDSTRRATTGRYARLIAMAGSGAPYSTYKSDEEVIAAIREFRGDE